MKKKNPSYKQTHLQFEKVILRVSEKFITDDAEKTLVVHRMEAWLPDEDEPFQESDWYKKFFKIITTHALLSELYHSAEIYFGIEFDMSGLDLELLPNSNIDVSTREVGMTITADEFVENYAPKIPKSFEQITSILFKDKDVRYLFGIILKVFYGLDSSNLISEKDFLQLILKFIMLYGVSGKLDHYIGIEAITQRQNVNTLTQNLSILKIVSVFFSLEQEWIKTAKDGAHRDQLSWGRTIYKKGKISWEQIDYPYCSKEAKMAKHCGNSGGRPNDLILSLREEVAKGRFKVRATFIINLSMAKEIDMGLEQSNLVTRIDKSKFALVEAKGFANAKVDEEYFEHVLWLLTNYISVIDYQLSYRNGNDFNPIWFDVDQIERLLEGNRKLLINHRAIKNKAVQGRYRADNSYITIAEYVEMYYE